MPHRRAKISESNDSKKSRTTNAKSSPSSATHSTPSSSPSTKGVPPNQWDPKPHGLMQLVSGETYHSKDEPRDDLVPTIDTSKLELGSSGGLL